MDSIANPVVALLFEVRFYHCHPTLFLRYPASPTSCSKLAGSSFRRPTQRFRLHPAWPLSAMTPRMCSGSRQWSFRLVAMVGNSSFNISTFFSSAPKLEAQTAGFSNEKNLKGIEEYGAAWASGDMERLLLILAPDFTLTLDGQQSKITRDSIPAYYETSRKKVKLFGTCLISQLTQLEERGGPDSSYADYRKIRKITAKEVQLFTLSMREAL